MTKMYFSDLFERPSPPESEVFGEGKALKSLYPGLHQLLFKVLSGISIAIEYVITEQQFPSQVNLQMEKFIFKNIL